MSNNKEFAVKNLYFVKQRLGWINNANEELQS